MALQPTLLDETSANTAVIKDWCHTREESKTFQFVWTIENVSSRGEAHGQFVESSIFPADFDAPKWILRAYPKGAPKLNMNSRTNNREYLAIEVVLYSGIKVNAKLQLSVMNDKNENFKTCERSGRSYDQGNLWFIDTFAKLEELSATGLLPQDTLTIFCEVNIVSKNVNISGHIHAVVPPNNLLEDLYDSEQFSDVKLIAGDHVLKAHKAILSVRSKVFAAMFHHPMKEQISDIVTITDVQHEVLKEMLRFLYTDKVSNLDAMAEELLVASDKYEITNLKRMCEESLRANVKVKNAANILILADQHNAKALKSEILKFIVANAKAVALTEGWGDMKTSHRELIDEVFWALVETVSK